ncbi:uncharacterized protein [Argopecten irradians]|uniref:uncharacterized protein n=1 Tax=Argopecten irradians TaxID=31199 RepID=UPI00371AE276
MEILGILYLLVTISTGNLVRGLIYTSGIGTWDTMRNTCQLISSSHLCDGIPDMCDVKVQLPAGQFWVGAYVDATTIIQYSGCKRITGSLSPDFTSANITLKDCTQTCHTMYQQNHNVDTIGLQIDSCYCTTRMRQESDEYGCDSPCTGDSGTICGSTQYMSTYEFNPVLSTQRGGSLSFTPQCGVWNNRFRDCQERRKAVCLNDLRSSTTMTWSEANKWCQDNNSQLSITSLQITFPNNMEPWINLVKHRFVKWTDEALPVDVTNCVSLLCEDDDGLCSFVSEKCSRQFPGLCWRTHDVNSPIHDSKITNSSPTSVMPPEPPLPTSSEKYNSSIPAVGISHSEDAGDDGMLVYILVAVAVVVVIIITVLIACRFCRKGKMNPSKASSTSSPNSIEEPALPLIEQSIIENRGSKNYDQVESDYDKVREDDKGNGIYDRIKSDYDPDYARVESFALQNEPEVGEDVPLTVRDIDDYDLLRNTKRPEREIDSTYDHLPAETEDDTYNVLQSQEDLNKDKIGDFMYDVTSAINGLGNYDTFSTNRNEDLSGEYDTTESILNSNS